jgi:hypothetical protein
MVRSYLRRPSATRYHHVVDIDNIWRLDATAQAALVRSGEVTPAELVEAAIARIAA